MRREPGRGLGTLAHPTPRSVSVLNSAFLPSTFDRLPAETPPPALQGYVAALCVFGLGLAGLMVVLSTRHLNMVFTQVLPTVIAMLLGSGACALGLLRRTRARWPLLLILPALTAALICLLLVLTLAEVKGRPLAQVMERPLVLRGLTSAPFLGALVGGGLWLLHRARQRERAAWQRAMSDRARHEQLQQERMLAHMQLLQAQIEPHFIYNTLANLRQLIRQDGERALQMLDHLIRYFKLTLPSFRADRLPLSDELDLVRAYLDLLRERLGRPLQLELEVPADWLALPMPPGALLCLVENAIKHGLPEQGGALQLRIAARREDARLHLSVRDNGAGLSATPRPGSTGLSNLRERLRLLYGEQAGLQLHNASPGCEAVLSLPWEGAR